MVEKTHVTHVFLFYCSLKSNFRPGFFAPFREGKAESAPRPPGRVPFSRYLQCPFAARAKESRALRGRHAREDAADAGVAGLELELEGAGGGGGEG